MSSSRCFRIALPIITFLLASVPGFARQPEFDLHQAQTEAVKFLSALVKINTSNPPGNETRAAEYMKRVLAANGIPSRIFESAPGRGNLVARLKGNGKKKPLLLMGHLDVVGVDRNKWTVDPFGSMVKNGYLYGRGSIDDKSMDAADLEVFLLLHRLKVPLDRDVILLAEAGEEGTPQFGIDYMIAKHWDQIACEYALNEGGSIAEEKGKVQYVAIATTEKVPRGFTLVARGTSGHGSIPRADNAIAHLAAAVDKVVHFETPLRLNETTRKFFQIIAGISPPKEAALYSNIEDPAVQDKLRATRPAYYSMMHTSLVPTIIKGGFRSNVVPAEAEARFDVRALPDEDMNKLKAELTALINDPQVSIIDADDAGQRPAAPPSSIDSAGFHALENAAGEVFPKVPVIPILQVGATDAGELRARGVQAYDIGTVGSEEDGKRIHGDDERVNINGLGKFVQFVFDATVDLAGAK